MSKVPVIHLDDVEQIPAEEAMPGLTVSGPDLDDSLFDGDEVVGARMYTYRGGRFHVNPNLYHGLENQPIKGRIRRWFVAHGFGPYGMGWHYQVSLGSATTASSAFTRALAVRECKKWIDEQVGAEPPREAE